MRSHPSLNFSVDPVWTVYPVIVVILLILSTPDAGGVKRRLNAKLPDSGRAIPPQFRFTAWHFRPPAVLPDLILTIGPMTTVVQIEGREAIARPVPEGKR